MELELCKETYSCYEALPPLVETREQSTETIVPDYCPDIARIVEGSGCLFVRSREIADGRVSVSGSLRVTLLYIADGSGGLKSFSYTLPVEETLDGRLREGCTEASVSGCVSALEVRALNPRKIMTRAAVELTVTPYCAALLTACGDVTQRAENGIETLCETQEVSIIKALRSKDFVFSDDLVLSSSKEPAAELLRESASVRTTECRLIGGKIILKGVVCVEVLYLSESGDHLQCRRGAALFPNRRGRRGCEREHLCRGDAVPDRRGAAHRRRERRRAHHLRKALPARLCRAAPKALPALHHRPLQHELRSLRADADA